MTLVEKQKINLFEKYGFDVHPALEVKEYDGWIMGFTEGYSRRANSIMAFDWGTIPAEEKLAECEKLYKAKGLRSIFKLTDASADGLNELLKNRGYSLECPTDFMTVGCNNETFLGKLETVEEPEDIGVIVTGEPDEAWLEAFYKFEHRTDPKTVSIVNRQFEILKTRENLTAIYCRIQIHGQDVAVASAVIEDGYMYLLNVVVDENCRGKGYGKILVKEILEAACNMGAETLCLQVIGDNTVAINLYKSFGFEYYYSYWYMVK